MLISLIHSKAAGFANAYIHIYWGRELDQFCWAGDHGKVEGFGLEITGNLREIGGDM